MCEASRGPERVRCCCLGFYRAKMQFSPPAAVRVQQRHIQAVETAGVGRNHLLKPPRFHTSHLSSIFNFYFMSSFA